MYPNQATLSFNGAVNGATIGVFTLGMFIPWANSIVSFTINLCKICGTETSFMKGAGVGILASFGTMMWLGVGSQIAKSRGLSHNQMKSLSIDNCPAAFNLTSNFGSRELV